MDIADDSADEGVARRLGPLRVAVWLREHGDYREDNSRLWQLRGALLRAPIWTSYSFDDVPLIPEWFGAVLPHDVAWERTGHPHVWCSMLGFPSSKVRAEAIEIIEDEKLPGLMLLERDAPEPTDYMLPTVGFIARDVYLTLEPEHPRRYDHWQRYETLGLPPDEEGALICLDVDAKSGGFDSLRELEAEHGKVR